jgi:hypothetical protein
MKVKPFETNSSNQNTSYSSLYRLVRKTGHFLRRSRIPIETDWNSGYRIIDQNSLLVAGSGGYGLNAEEVLDWVNHEMTCSQNG